MKRVALFVVWFSWIAAAASAQMYETVGVRAQGMGGAFVAVADDSTATWWNPAGLATGPYFDFTAQYVSSDITTDQRTLGVAVAFPAMGLSYYRLPVSQMRTALAIGNDPLSRQDQGYLSQLGATFGQSLGHIVVASTVKVLHAGDDTHVDLDLGAMVALGHAKAGVSLRNLHETDYAIPGAAPLSLKRIARAGVSFTAAPGGVVLTAAGDADLTTVTTAGGEERRIAGAAPLSLKRIARAGVSFSASPGGVILTAAGDADLTTVTTAGGEERRIAGGVEAWVWKRIIGIRGGLSQETEHSVHAQSGGLSLMVLSGQYLHFYVDGQWTGGSDLVRRGWSVQTRLTF